MTDDELILVKNLINRLDEAIQHDDGLDHPYTELYATALSVALDLQRLLDAHS